MQMAEEYDNLFNVIIEELTWNTNNRDNFYKTIRDFETRYLRLKDAEMYQGMPSYEPINPATNVP